MNIDASAFPPLRLSIFVSWLSAPEHLNLRFGSEGGDFQLLCLSMRGSGASDSGESMIVIRHYFLITTFLLALPWAHVTGQTLSPPVQDQASLAKTLPATPLSLLSDFKDSDIKFHLQTFMSILRDRNHEGWVMVAYPDPVTNGPLIGAGFNLEVAATDHPQRDPLNPHPFIEPSTAELWQAAGLGPELLQRTLDRFHHNLETWGKKNFRRKIRTHALSPDLTQEEATRLLRISAIQAIQNARAYCRDFDQLTAPQQMALSQLVFQMGVNLEEFVEFLGALNDGATSSDSDAEMAHWKAVQHTLIDSQWARRYTLRAATVIAMFDPEYVENPAGAVRSIEAVLRPPKHHRRSSRRALTASTKKAAA
jgi:GH24 family phage-related lysozyme (muramidase)